MKNYRLVEVLKELNISHDRANHFLYLKGIKKKVKFDTMIDKATHQLFIDEFGSETINDNKFGKAIAFKNFRRFEEFPKLRLGNLTYMVGRNNSGKSTMVKALILIIDYLQNQMLDKFSFDNLVLEDANIVTFDRALNNTAKEPFINFNLRLNNYSIDIYVSGKQDSTKGDVNRLRIRDLHKGYDVKINFIENLLKITKQITVEKVEVNYKENIIKLRNEIKELSAKKNNENTSTSERLEISDQINRNIKKLEKLTQNMATDMDNDTEAYSLEYPLKDDYELYQNNYFLNAIENFIYLNKTKYGDLKKDEFSQKESIKNLINSQNDLRSWATKFTNKIKSQYFYYVSANPSKQSALFSIRDKDNALSQAIHKYKQLQILEGQEEDLFLKKWMKVFEVGNDYNIKMRAGEAYEFIVIDDNRKVNLADKGMGSLQAMTLILKISSLIRINKKNKKSVTVLVEEPELNLHPALQSKLTDFFYDVYVKYKFDFIVETHSEYIIRRAQLLALENGYLSNQNTDENPFSIFYFHKDEGPYQMKFNDQGKFDREFGTGFYDEAGSLTMKMIKEIRKKQNI